MKNGGKRQAKPRIALAAIKAIIRKVMEEARQRLAAEDDGLNRLIRALRRPKRAAARTRKHKGRKAA